MNSVWMVSNIAVHELVSAVERYEGGIERVGMQPYALQCIIHRNLEQLSSWDDQLKLLQIILLPSFPRQ